MELYELLLIPVYILILALIISPLKKIATSNQVEFFYPAFLVKVFFAISAGLVYKYIYYGGDTYNFYSIAQVFYS